MASPTPKPSPSASASSAPALTNDQAFAQQFGGPAPQYSISYTGTGTALSSKGVEYFIMPSADGKDYSILTADQVMNAYLKSGNKEALRTALYNAKFINKAEWATKDDAALRTGIIDFARRYTVNTVQNFFDTGKANISTATSWLKSYGGQLASAGLGPSGTGGGSGTTKESTSSTALSSAKQADNELDNFFIEQLGRPATAAEHADYRTKLAAEEKAVPAKRTTTTKTTSGADVTSITGSTTTVGAGGLTQADHDRVLGTVLSTAIKAMPADELAKSTGTVGQNISELRAYAADFGLPNYTADMAKSHLVDRYASGAPASTATVEAEKLAIRNIAKGFHPNLASIIDQGTKVSSIAAQYQKQMQTTLELPDQGIDWVNDPYISKALANKNADGTPNKDGGTMSLNDFTIMLRQDPRWAKTKNAREEASSYANSILESFGLA